MLSGRARRERADRRHQPQVGLAIGATIVTVAAVVLAPDAVDVVPDPPAAR